MPEINSAPFMSLSEQLCSDAGIIPGTDLHQLEMPLFPFHFRHQLSAFMGSSGTLVYTRKGKYAIWSDGRYEEALQKTKIPHFITGEQNWDEQIQWLAKHRARSVSLCDYQCSIADFTKISRAARKHGIAVRTHSLAQFVETCASASARYKHYLNSSVTAQNSLIAVPERLLFSSVQEEEHSPLQRLLLFLQAKRIGAYLSSSLHEIAYLTGLRGWLQTLMLFPAVMIVESNASIILWLPDAMQTRRNIRTICAQIVRQLPDATFSLTLKSYEKALENLPEEIRKTGVSTISADRSIVPASLRKNRLKSIKSPIKQWRSTYSETQLRSLTRCLRFDSCALLESMAAVHTRLLSGTKIDETAVQDIILGEKQKLPTFLQLSFASIVASGKNSVQPHYDGNGRERLLSLEKPLLIDCGGHYKFGSSDITRVFYFGNNPPAELREDYSFVLRAHIALLTQNFENNCAGAAIDSRVRSVLNQSGRDYKHGTGHGIGFCSDVHDGYFHLGPRHRQLRCVPSLVLSNEPGYYRTDKWGIRLENIVVSRLANANSIVFDTLTYFPFQNSLIESKLLLPAEQEWLSKYQKKCRKLYEKKLSSDGKRFLNFMLA